jgi:uncharacterized protein (TIGR02453 family)
MAQLREFTGFPRECVRFFLDLRGNNNKAWFDAHRPEYDAYVMEPARQFVMAMGEQLRQIAPGVHAEPEVNRSIFRIHRDTRFSKDKTPYKTNLALLFWEGDGPRMECPGFYFHLEPPNLLLGLGIHIFSDALLSAYRQAVLDPQLGPALAEAVQSVSQTGIYSLGGLHYKRVPQGYDPNHPRAGFLQYNGLTVGQETPIPEALYTPEIVATCYHHYREMSPIQAWLRALTNRMERS